ncbi:hypothetical protein B2G67_08300 [Microbacterium foliorum]|nr:hypothetical protein B2G67_08300 [Microbacterium foliorum]KIP95448.1 hypothetical protein RU09_01235 [Microbacterium sp. MEJ108Y]
MFSPLCPERASGSLQSASSLHLADAENTGILNNSERRANVQNHSVAGSRHVWPAMSVVGHTFES